MNSIAAQHVSEVSERSRTGVWMGRALSGLAVLFLTFDVAVKLLMAPAAVQATTQLGYPASTIAVIGVVELVCLIAYVVPRTAALGALLWTGYLGGAIATHVRVGNPLATHTLFPLYVAALLWGGLYLRDRRLRDAVRTLRAPSVSERDRAGAPRP